MNSDSSQDPAPLDPTLRDLQPELKVFQRYTLIDRVGRGGMSVVWRARNDTLEDDIVAIKFVPEMQALDPKAVHDLKRETRRCLDLTHVNIVRVRDFVTERSRAGIVMEFVPGDTLAAICARRPHGVLRPSEIEPWLPQIDAGLTFAHERGYVHRDLKPANLMVTPQGTVKILDFGVAAVISQTQMRLSNLSVTGTPCYMSPQQLNGEPPALSHDIYALGATLYELLSGMPPFFRGDLTLQILQHPPPPIAERRRELGVPADVPPVPAHWENTILACLAKDPAARPQSVSEIRQRLAAPSTQRTKPTQPAGTAPSGSHAETTRAASASRSMSQATPTPGAAAARAAAPPQPGTAAKTSKPTTAPDAMFARLQRLMRPGTGLGSYRLLVAIAIILYAVALWLPALGPRSGGNVLVDSGRMLSAFFVEIPWLTLRGKAALTSLSFISTQQIAWLLAHTLALALAHATFVVGALLALWRGRWPVALSIALAAASLTLIGGMFWNGMTFGLRDDLRAGYYFALAAVLVLTVACIRDLLRPAMRISISAELAQEDAFGLAGKILGGWTAVAVIVAAVQLNRSASTAAARQTAKAAPAAASPKASAEKRAPTAAGTSPRLVRQDSPASSWWPQPSPGIVGNSGTKAPLSGTTLWPTAPNRTLSTPWNTAGGPQSTTTAATGTRGARPLTLAGLWPRAGSEWRIADLDLTLAWIAPGTFVMGSPDTEPQREEHEGPQTTVEIKSGFWLGRTEVTQAQWRAIMGTTLQQQHDLVRRGTMQTAEGADLPMGWVSWHEAVEFCRRLTQRERDAGRLPVGHSFTLPSEAQWEYACRAGTTTRYAGPLEQLSWHAVDQPSAVARKSPNAWGLFDMHGNLAEWCANPYFKYPGGTVADPIPAPPNRATIYRGGNWFHPENAARSAARCFREPDFRSFWLGFRVALVAPHSAP